jgi:hypothetical protein
MTDDMPSAPPFVPPAPQVLPVTPDGYVPPPGYVLAPAVAPVRSKRLGQVACFIAIVLFLGTIAVSVIIGVGAVPFTVRNPAGGFQYFLNANSSNPTEAALAVAGLVQGFLGTALGIWALVQGIVAVATRRGRAYGVVAIVLAGLGPLVTLGVTLLTVAVNLH